ncbi:TadE/TadG family type IV pilus assembly protein [Roseibium alexandrii]|uniref:Flp pilus assembly protein TadG n=1 Tax=Roseibium alexandrii (strain DSM 17067 / NCIMB 14079 / DFL-11) TaxID=244592 RepID=A0A5E8GW84_ROSAD|nr:TadE/TadG family type IV pilus assembly protein [Roseibium alexandrii]EEE43836.1 Flp pilus assembly protein TadG [Roseibium alexandrii DFL-11]
MIKALISKFNRNQDGSILPIFAGMVLVLVVIGGAAIDISRAVNAREKLAYAIDAAALSVATDLSTTVLRDNQIKTRIENSFRANLSDAEFLDQAIDNLDFDVDSNAGTVTVSSSAGLNNYFLNIPGFGKDGLGPDVFNFGTSAEVNYSRFDVELALVVDVTGSMAGDMGALRDAAEEVVDILIEDDASNSASKVRISLVPYSQGVNLGSYASTVTNGSTSWRNCVNEREGQQKYTDAVYNYDGTNSEYFHGLQSYFIWDYGSSENWSSARDDCPSSSLQPLTSDKNTLISDIRNLSSGGGTGGQTGVAWGWYTLSPNWTSLWPTDSDPEPYGNGTPDDDVKKFALIMTDGDFNAQYGKEERTTCTGRGRNRVCTTNEYWVERYHRYSDYNDPPATRARTLCDAMKAENIEIFTVFFDTGGSAFGDDLMSYCASGSDYYYEADNKDELITAFSNIAKRIQQIYLSQ